MTNELEKSLKDGITVDAGLRKIHVCKDRDLVSLSVCTNGYQSATVRMDPDMVEWALFALKTYLSIADEANCKEKPNESA